MERTVIFVLVSLLWAFKMFPQAPDEKVDKYYQFYSTKVASSWPRNINIGNVRYGEVFWSDFHRLRYISDELYPYYLSYDIDVYQWQQFDLWYKCYRNRITWDLIEDISTLEKHISQAYIKAITTNTDPDTTWIYLEKQYLGNRLKRRGIRSDIFPNNNMQDTICNIDKNTLDYFKNNLRPIQCEFDKIEKGNRRWDVDSVTLNRNLLEIVFVAEVLSDQNIYNPHSNSISRIQFDIIKDWTVERLCGIPFSLIEFLVEYYNQNMSITDEDIILLKKHAKTQFSETSHD